MTPRHADVPSTTVLKSRLAAAVAYAGWWVSGLAIWAFERRDRYVRFHAAQAMIVFGAFAVVVGLLAGMAALSLVFMPKAFTLWVWTAGVAWLMGIALWVVSMWNAATGRAWRLPVAGKLAERICRN